ncbi:hypothetical protein PanWU01x14_171120 [Parasponia andersonii]|uniref:Uncharacterized protein n=1 Tax=Parasponia andersonii TaxID=3476 RepID=A0A2P5C9J9_PARAD|nr:hypothetical protein PanWU01x14_171120 [Parasponia andersonii]
MPFRGEEKNVGLHCVTSRLVAREEQDCGGYDFCDRSCMHDTCWEKVSNTNMAFSKPSPATD